MRAPGEGSGGGSSVANLYWTQLGARQFENSLSTCIVSFGVTFCCYCGEIAGTWLLDMVMQWLEVIWKCSHSPCTNHCETAETNGGKWGNAMCSRCRLEQQLNCIDQFTFLNQ